MEDLHKLEFRRLGLSPHALLCLYLSPLCGVFSLREEREREGLVCERVTAPTLSLRHSFVGSLSLSFSVLFSMYKYIRWVPPHGRGASFSVQMVEESFFPSFHRILRNLVWSLN